MLLPNGLRNVNFLQYCVRLSEYRLPRNSKLQVEIINADRKCSQRHEKKTKKNTENKFLGNKNEKNVRECWIKTCSSWCIYYMKFKYKIQYYLTSNT